MGDSDWEQQTGRNRWEFQIGKRIREGTGRSFTLRTEEGKKQKGRLRQGISEWNEPMGEEEEQEPIFRKGIEGGKEQKWVFRLGTEDGKIQVRVSDWEGKTGRNRLEFLTGSRRREVTCGRFRQGTQDGKEQDGRFILGTEDGRERDGSFNLVIEYREQEEIF